MEFCVDYIVALMQFQATLRKPEDYLGIVRLQTELLPEYLPTKWGFTEPFRRIFDPNKLSDLIPPGKSSMETASWKRTGKDRAAGSWNTRYDLLPETGLGHNHAMIKISIPSTSKKHQASLIRFFTEGPRHFGVNFCFIDAFTGQYKPIGVENGFISFGGHLSISTHKLRHWLPDMPWAAVFGRDYIHMFGRERLLSVPVYKTELLTDDAVFIQLTPSLQDLWNDFDGVMQKREEVKRYLGYEHFFQKALAYDWQEHPENAGKVYRVPTFHFIED